MEDPGSLPSSSSSWRRGRLSELGSLALGLAKVVQRRLGPKGTAGPLLRKEGWRAVSAVLRARVPEPSKHNTPPASPATLAWPLPFGIPALLAAQGLLPAHFSTLFLPHSPGEAQASVHWDAVESTPRQS